MAIKLDVWKILHGRLRLLPWPNFLLTRMLTRDLFAIANLFVYDATLLQSAVLVSTILSIRLFAWKIRDSCVKAAKHNTRTFSPPGSSIIPGFSHQNILSLVILGYNVQFILLDCSLEISKILSDVTKADKYNCSAEKKRQQNTKCEICFSGRYFWFNNTAVYNCRYVLNFQKFDVYPSRFTL